jgi:hypothetical protein
MMKRILITILVLLMIVGLAACSNPLEAAVSQAAEDNAAQESSADASQESSESASQDTSDSGDDQMDIDISGDENGMAWPSDKLPSGIPEISGVKVVLVMDMGDGVSVGFEGLTQANAESFISQLEGMGWETVMDIDAEEGRSQMLTKGDETLQLNWSSEDGTGALLYILS